MAMRSKQARHLPSGPLAVCWQVLCSCCEKAQCCLLPDGRCAKAMGCANCGTFNAASGRGLDVCGGCRRRAYCSRACQMQHWKVGGHKQECEGAGGCLNYIKLVAHDLSG